MINPRITGNSNVGFIFYSVTPMKDSKTEALSLQQFAADFHKETSQKLREMKSRHMKELKILYRLRRAK